MVLYMAVNIVKGHAYKGWFLIKVIKSCNYN